MGILAGGIGRAVYMICSLFSKKAPVDLLAFTMRVHDACLKTSGSHHIRRSML